MDYDKHTIITYMYEIAKTKLYKVNINRLENRQFYKIVEEFNVIL